MELKQMTQESLLFLDKEWDTKADVIKHLVDALYEQGCIDSKEAFLEAVMQREKESPTGLEKGLAIPHGKSATVKKAAFAFARLKNAVKDWESLIADNQVQYVFLLAVPAGEANTTHLAMLSALSTRLMNERYFEGIKTADTTQAFLQALDFEESSTQETPVAAATNKVVLAVTACATGIAHTYMAAEALSKAGAELGIEVYTEKQGASGIVDKFTEEQIKRADAVIFANDVALIGKERFHGKQYIQTKVAEPLKEAKSLLQKALDKPDGVVKEESASKDTDKKQSFGASLYRAILTGMSYMIPVIVAAGLMIGLSRLLALPFGLGEKISDAEYLTSENGFLKILAYLNLFGNFVFKFMFPVFSAYVAFSIAGRSGIVSGLLGGAFAAGMHFTFWGAGATATATLWGTSGIASGFLGAVILGLVAGIVSKFLNEKIKVHKNLEAIKPMLIVPSLSVLAIFLLNYALVEPVFGGVNKWLQETIANASGGSTLVLAGIIAAATAFDLGGPINKAAGTIAIGLAADMIFPLTARVIAIVIPPIGLGLATVLDKFIVRKRVFSEDLRVAGSTSIVLGFIAISEGAIPFMLKNPLITIPINVIGAVLGSCLAVALGAVQWLPLPAIWGWALVTNIVAYLVGLFAGVLFVALANIVVRFFLLKRTEKKAVQA
ncbi:MAG: fructose-specific PTS transporter subunit EIIC [Firmicutes bacterium]|nr:fructose-specific PTS transporter subunit EIIC [Bacillota bacterium]